MKKAHSCETPRRRGFAIAMNSPAAAFASVTRSVATVLASVTRSVAATLASVTRSDAADFAPVTRSRARSLLVTQRAYRTRTVRELLRHSQASNHTYSVKMDEEI